MRCAARLLLLIHVLAVLPACAPRQWEEELEAEHSAVAERASSTPAPAPPAPELAPPATPADLSAYWDTAAGAYLVSPSDLLRCDAINPVATVELGKRGPVRINGFIGDIRLGPLGGKYLDVDGLTCHFETTDGAAFIGLAPGQPICVEGHWIGNRSLAQCRLVR